MNEIEARVAKATGVSVPQLLELMRREALLWKRYKKMMKDQVG